MGRVDIADKFQERGGLGDTGVEVMDGRDKGIVRELKTGGRSPVVDAPVYGGTEIKGNSLEGSEVDSTGSGGEFGQGSDCIADVGARDDIGVQQFTKESAVGIANLIFKGGVLRCVLGRANSIVEAGHLRRQETFKRFDIWLGFP